MTSRGNDLQGFWGEWPQLTPLGASPFWGAASEIRAKGIQNVSRFSRNFNVTENRKYSRTSLIRTPNRAQCPYYTQRGVGIGKVTMMDVSFKSPLTVKSVFNQCQCLRNRRPEMEHTAQWEQWGELSIWSPECPGDEEVLKSCMNLLPKAEIQCPLSVLDGSVLQRFFLLFERKYLRILSVHKILLVTFKMLHGVAPSYLKDLVSVLPDSHYQLRRNNKGILLERTRLRTKTIMGDRAFSIASPFLWNSLPLPIRQETSIDSFKRSVKTYYIVIFKSSIFY